jgi:hypothetical protein
MKHYPVHSDLRACISREPKPGQRESGPGSVPDVRQVTGKTEVSPIGRPASSPVVHTPQNASGNSSWDFTGIGANKAGARTKKRTGIGDDASLFGINNDKSGYSASGLIWKTADKVTNA